MLGGGVAILIDVLVMALLAITVLFAARLTYHLKIFRESREGLEVLVGELSRTIEQAESSVSGLRETTREAGRDLQELINEAYALSEELQIITESGDSMAGRLERLAERNVRLSKKMSSNVAINKEISDVEEKLDFSIYDTDSDIDDDIRDETEPSVDKENGNILYSRAERELYEALHGGDV